MDQPALSPEVLPLPSGGGATRGIGDTFVADLHTGTGSYRVPLWFPRGPGRLQPSMELVYSSGAGQGTFGMGWRLPLMRIARRTDRGVPTYDQADTLLLDGEEIVPVGGGRYRHARERRFPFVERVGDGWVVRDKGGRRAELGTTAAARVETTVAGRTRTYAWLVERVVDPNGNEIRYAYIGDGPHRDLASITYGLYQVEFAYEPRPDPSVLRRAGFPIPLTRRCTSIRYRLVGDPDPLFRRYDLTYDEAPFTRISLLASVTFSGRRQLPSGSGTASFPTLRFGYSRFEPAGRLHTFAPAGATPPAALDDPAVDLADLDGSGRPGVVELGGVVRRYWANRGDGRWSPPRTLRRLPAGVTLEHPTVAFADVDGNLMADLLDLGRKPLSYFRSEPGLGLVDRVRFRAAPSFAPEDPQVRLVDVDGDGRVDAIRTGRTRFSVYANRGDAGWAPPYGVPRVHDLARFPDVYFSDPRVKLASVTGDGLADIVLVHGGRIDYWPSLGHGRFGARVTLALTPAIGRGFDPRRLFLVDVDGDGRADVVYAGADRVLLWINRAGEELVPAGATRHTPPATTPSLRPADLLGRGTAGLAWSVPARRPADRNYRFLDLTGPDRPYLLTSVDDGTGQVTGIGYEPSTVHERAARDAGTPWRTALPFPVQTIARIVRRDAVAGTQVEQVFRYHDGWFDPRAREFRGFGRVEALEVGDAEVPSTRTVSWFHQGRPGELPGVGGPGRGALAGRLRRLEVFGPDGTAAAALPYRVEENAYGVRTVGTALDGSALVFPFLESSTVRTFDDRQAAPLVNHTSFTYDDYGNVAGRRERWDSGASVKELVTTIGYTTDQTRWILDRAVEVVRTDPRAGLLLGCTRLYYDGPDYVGLPSGQVTRGNLSRREELVLTDGMASAFGSPAPDFAALGYHRMTAPGNVTGWGADTLRERHDGHGNPAGRQDALGNTGEIAYDPSGTFPTAVVDPDQHRHEVDYDPRAGEIARLAEPNGHETRYRFDPIGRVVAMVKPGDSDALPTARFEYLDAARPLGVVTHLRVDAGSAATRELAEYFDGSGRTAQRRAAGEGGKAVVDGWRRYNRRGWEAERTPQFLSTGLDYVAGEGGSAPRRFRFRYDALGRVVETVTPDGRTSRTVFERGLVRQFDVSDTDDSPANIARGHHDTPREQRTDARGRLLSVTEAAVRGSPLTTSYERDALGRLVTITDPRAVRTAEHLYDLAGRLIRVRHVDAGERLMLHDARGQHALLVDATGRTVELAHDALGRLAQVTVDGTVTESYDYDTGPGDNLVGRLARVRDEVGEVRLSYTDRGLLKERRRTIGSLTGPRTFTVAFGYDSMERMRRVTYPDGARVDYDYNARGLLDRVGGVIDGIDYDATGRAVEVRHANGVTERSTFDPATFYLREAKVTGPARTAPYYHATYGYDAVGNPLTITDLVTVAGHPRLDRGFDYDALYRLTGVGGTLDGVAFRRDYRYDDAGNFTRNDELGPDGLYVEPGASNRLRGTVAGGVRTPLFDHDANGNLVAMPGLQLTFDARGRLRTLLGDDGTTAEYGYAYDGRRARKRVTDSAGAREVLYVDNLFEVRDGVAIRHVFAGMSRMASVAGSGGAVHYHRDHLGSTVLLTDGAGAIVQERGHLPFGGTAFATGTRAEPHRFLGNELDGESGLVYCHSRYYHPGLGRFITPDLPVVLAPEDALGSPAALNPYAYAMNNPVRLVDADGAQWGWVLGGLVIAGLVAATIAVGIVTGGAGFAFGVVLAATIGAGIGAGLGVYSASRRGGSLEQGFAFGAVMGAVAGASGYAFGAHIAGALGPGLLSAQVVSGAVQGAIIGAGNGAIIGYAGGAGTPGQILEQAAIGAAVGAALGGVGGYLRWARPDLPGLARAGLDKLWTKVFEGGPTSVAADKATQLVAWLAEVPQFFLSVNLAAPTVIAELGTIAHLGIREHKDFFTSLCPGGECIIEHDFGDL